MHGTLDQLNPTGDSVCISLTPRKIESTKESHFFKVLCHSKGTTMELYYTNSKEIITEIIKLYKVKAREPSKHLQALEQLRKIFNNTTYAAIMRVNTTTALTTPTKAYSLSHKDTVKWYHKSISDKHAKSLRSCPQHHQKLQFIHIMNPNSHHAYNSISSPKMMTTTLWLSILSNIKSDTILHNIST